MNNWQRRILELLEQYCKEHPGCTFDEALIELDVVEIDGTDWAIDEESDKDKYNRVLKAHKQIQKQKL